MSIKVSYNPNDIEKKRIFIDIDGNQYDQPTSGLQPKIEPTKKATPNEELDPNAGGNQQALGGEKGEGDEGKN
jgi:hypothetical protein